MKKLLFIIVLMIAVISVRAQQEFTFMYQQEEMAEVESQSDIKKHDFGEDIAYKFQLLKERYTYVEPGSATSPSDKIIIEKQPIFFAVKKLDKHFRKSVKKVGVSKEDAVSELENALNIAINIRYQDTQELEDLLYTEIRGKQRNSIMRKLIGRLSTVHRERYKSLAKEACSKKI